MESFNIWFPGKHALSTQGVGKQTKWVTFSESVANLEKRVNAPEEREKGKAAARCRGNGGEDWGGGGVMGFNKVFRQCKTLSNILDWFIH